MVVDKKLVTVEEFERFLALPENRDRLFELIDGEIVEKVPTEKHSIVAGNFYVALRTYAKTTGGRAVFEVRVRVPQDTGNARIPDVAYTAPERLLPVVEEGAVPQIPDVCVEVQSPDDSPKDLRDKAEYYLKHGARLVFLAYPRKRMVEALYPDGEFDIYTENDTLTGGDTLPGFALAVREIFED